MDNVGVSGVQSVKSAKNSKETIGQQNAKRTSAVQHTPLRRSKRNKSMSEDHQIYASSSVPVTKNLSKKKLEDSLKTLRKRPSHCDRKSTETSPNKSVSLDSDQIGRGSAIQSVQPEGRKFHENQAPNCSPSSSDSICCRVTQQNSTETTAVPQARGCDTARCDKEDKYGEEGVEYTNTMDSHTKRELPGVNKDKSLCCDDESPHVTEVGSFPLMTLNTAGEAHGSWTKIMQSVNKDHTLDVQLMVQNSRKRLDSYCLVLFYW